MDCHELKITELGVEYGSILDLKLDVTGKVETPKGLIFYPNNTQEVSSLMKCSFENDIPVTVIGGATNLNGATIPEKGGISISLKKMDEVEVCSYDRTAIVECGCNTSEFVEVIKKKGLIFPQNIASASRSTIGGNLAISSGSPWSFYYGTTKNYVLNLEIVLSDGTIINTGKNVTKNATGLNLTQLMIGCEGALGVITKATFRLLVPKKFKMVVQLTFQNQDLLFKAFKQVFISGYNPLSIEFMDPFGVKLVKEFIGESSNVEIDEGGVLWMEWESNNSDELDNITSELKDDLNSLISGFKIQKGNDVGDIWNYRKNIGYAVESISKFEDIDVVVPRSRIKDLYSFVSEICTKSHVKFTAFAHIGDGNLHINLLQEKHSDSSWMVLVDQIRTEIFKTAISLGGDISGEHGIGVKQKEYIDSFFPQKNKELNKAIKRVFDPKGMLNPALMYT